MAYRGSRPAAADHVLVEILARAEVNRPRWPCMRRAGS
jgi:hypothetical protein